MTDIVKKDLAVVQSKREAWATVGEVIHHKELELQVSKEGLITELIECKSIEQIPQIEEALKKTKQGLKIHVEKRMNVTNTLTEVVSRLMLPEKAVQEAISNNEAGLLKLKQAEQAQKKKASDKLEETRRITEACLKHVNDAEAYFKGQIVQNVAKAFEYALGAGKIDEAGLPAYLERVNAKYKVENFEILAPTITLVNVTKIEFDLIWQQALINAKNPETYITDYQAMIKEKFEFYNVSLKNAAAAIQHNNNKASEQLTQVNAEADKKNVAATLQTMATSVSAPAVSTSKALKEVFVLDMEETHENALQIMAAFVGNYDKTKEHIKVKPFNLNVGQMAAALVAIKNKDSNFNCTGIKFTTKQKL